MLKKTTDKLFLSKLVNIQACVLCKYEFVGEVARIPLLPMICGLNKKPKKTPNRYAET